MRNPKDIRNEIAFTAESLKKDEAVYQQIADDIENTKRTRQKLLRELRELDTKEETLLTTYHETRSRIKLGKANVEKLEREAHRVTQEAALWSKYEAKAKILDIMTSDAPWRVDAKIHQLEGAKQLAIAGRAILGDKMGLGKTLSSIIWLDMVEAQKVIVFAPKEAVSAFRKQMPRWAPHRHLFDLTSKGKHERNAVLEVLPFMDEWTILINIETWRFDPTIIKRLQLLCADSIIVDEAHSIKESTTVAFEGVDSIVYPYPQDEACSVKNVLPMSGTVFLNYPDEMWPLLYLVDRKAWPTKTKFRDDYLTQNADGRFVFNKWLGGEEKLLQALGIRFLQRNLKDSGVVLPPQELRVHEIDFDAKKYPKQYKAYRDLETRSAMLMENMSESKVMGVEGLALLTRLRQMIVWPFGIKMKDPETGEVIFRSNIRESVKLDYAENLINEIVKMQDDRVVVFSQFIDPLFELRDRLQEFGVSVAVLTGATVDSRRQEIKRDFDRQQTTNGQHKWDVVLAHYKVGGQSLDLTGARQMVILDEEWNPGRNSQAYGRTQRIGQTEETIVHILRTPNTVDIDMEEINSRKEEGYSAFEVAMQAGAQYLREKK